MTQIAYFGSFWAQFRVSWDLFTDLTVGRPRLKFSYHGNIQQPFQLKIVRTEKK